MKHKKKESEKKIKFKNTDTTYVSEKQGVIKIGEKNKPKKKKNK